MTHHFSKFTGLMQNFDIATRATEASINSQNSALIENEKYLNSVSGQWSLFKTNMEGVYAQLMKSDTLKDIIHMINISVTGVGNLISHVGLLKTALVGLNVYLMAFKKNGKIFDMSFDVDTKKFDLGGKLKKATESISEFKKKWAELNQLTKYSGSNGEFVKIPSTLDKIKNAFTALTGATLKQVSANLALKAVSGVFNIAIGGVVGAIEAFAFDKIFSMISSGLNSAEEARQKALELYQTSQQNIQTYQDNISQIQSMSSEYETLSSKTKLTKEETERYVEIKRTLGGMFPDIIQGINTETGEIDLQKKSVQELVKAMQDKIRLENIKIVHDTGKVKYDESIKAQKEAMTSLVSINGMIEENKRKIDNLTNTLTKAGASQEQIDSQLNPFKNQQTQLLQQLDVAKQKLSDSKDIFKPLIKAMFDAGLETSKLSDKQKKFVSDLQNNIDFTKIKGGYDGIHTAIIQITKALNGGKDKINSDIRNAINDIIQIEDLLSKNPSNKDNLISKANVDLATLGRLLNITDLDALKGLIDLLNKEANDNSAINKSAQSIDDLQKGLSSALEKIKSTRTAIETLKKDGITEDLASEILGNPEKFGEKSQVLEALVSGNRTKLLSILKGTNAQALKDYQDNGKQVLSTQTVNNQALVKLDKEYSNWKQHTSKDNSEQLLKIDEWYIKEKNKILGINDPKAFAKALGIDVKDFSNAYQSDLDTFRKYLVDKITLIKESIKAVQIAMTDVGIKVTTDAKGNPLPLQRPFESPDSVKLGKDGKFHLDENAQKNIAEYEKYTKQIQGLNGVLDKLGKVKVIKPNVVIPQDKDDKKKKSESTGANVSGQKVEIAGRYQEILEKIAVSENKIKEIEGQLINAGDLQKIEIYKKLNAELEKQKGLKQDLLTAEKKEESDIKKKKSGKYSVSEFLNSDGTINWDKFNAEAKKANSSKDKDDNKWLNEIKTNLLRLNALGKEMNDTNSDITTLNNNMKKNSKEAQEALQNVYKIDDAKRYKKATEENEKAVEKLGSAYEKLKNDLDNLDENDYQGRLRITEQMLKNTSDTIAKNQDTYNKLAHTQFKTQEEKEKAQEKMVKLDADNNNLIKQRVELLKSEGVLRANNLILAGEGKYKYNQNKIDLLGEIDSDKKREQVDAINKDTLNGKQNDLVKVLARIAVLKAKKNKSEDENTELSTLLESVPELEKDIISLQGALKSSEMTKLNKEYENSLKGVNEELERLDENFNNLGENDYDQKIGVLTQKTETLKTKLNTINQKYDEAYASFLANDNIIDYEEQAKLDSMDNEKKSVNKEIANNNKAIQEQIKAKAKYQQDSFFANLDEKLEKYNQISNELQDQIDLLDENDYAKKAELTKQLMQNEENRRKQLQENLALAIKARDAIQDKTSEAWKQADKEVLKYQDDIRESEKTTKSLAKTTKELNKEWQDAGKDIFNQIVSALKEQYSKQQETELSNLKKEHDAISNSINGRIELLKQELELLQDEKSEMASNLSSLESDRASWAKDDSNLGKLKVDELDKKIADQKKQLAIKTKQEEIKTEEDKLKKYEDIWKTEEDKVNEKYKKLLDDTYLNEQAINMMKQSKTKEGQDAIINLLKSYDKDYQAMGKLLGESFITQWTKAITDKLATFNMNGLLNPTITPTVVTTSSTTPQATPQTSATNNQTSNTNASSGNNNTGIPSSIIAKPTVSSMESLLNNSELQVIAQKVQPYLNKMGLSSVMSNKNVLHGMLPDVKIPDYGKVEVKSNITNHYHDAVVKNEIENHNTSEFTDKNNYNNFENMIKKQVNHRV